MRGCTGFYPIGDMRPLLGGTVVTPTKRVIGTRGEQSSVDMHIPPMMRATNPIFTYAVATKKPFTPVATSHTLSTGEFVKRGLEETNCSPLFRGTATGDRSSSPQG